MLDNVRADGDLVKRFKLEALRETLTLEYPSYILALAMGAGKTVLIGAIYASEFAMAQEYTDGRFVQNALVLAPRQDHHRKPCATPSYPSSCAARCASNRRGTIVRAQEPSVCISHA